MRNAAIAALATLLASPAAAQTRPLLAPTRDVTVDYTLQPAHGRGPIAVQVAIQAAGSRLRITSPDLPTTLLVDRRAETAAILLPLLRAYTVIDIRKYDLQSTLLAGASFTRAGPGQVAGRACTEWHARAADGEAEACITEDGVILKGHATSNRHGEAGAVVAGRVSYDPLPRDSFDIPADYMHSPLPLTAEGMAP